MVFFILRKFDSFKKRPVLVNVLLVAGLLLYSFAGGVVFTLWEADADIAHEAHIQKSIIECTTLYLSINDYYSPSHKAQELWNICVNTSIPHSFPWTIVAATVFSFSSITTVGFGPLELSTHNARLFYIFYCLVGMPIGLVLMANVGKYLEEGVGWIQGMLDKWKYRREKHRQKQNRSLEDGGPVEDIVEGEQEEKEEEGEEYEITPTAVLILFFIYATLGVLALVLYSGTHAIDAIYTNFLTFIALDLSGTVSTDWFLFPLGIAYVVLGLALAALVIDVLGTWLRKLHYMGRKPQNCGNAHIWFGGERMTVNNLLDAVADKLGVDKQLLRNIDLDNVVQQEVAIMSGEIEREPVEHSPTPQPAWEVPMICNQLTQTDAIHTTDECVQTVATPAPDRHTQTEIIQQHTYQTQTEATVTHDRMVQTDPKPASHERLVQTDPKPATIEMEVQTELKISREQPVQTDTIEEREREMQTDAREEQEQESQTEIKLSVEQDSQTDHAPLRDRTAQTEPKLEQEREMQTEAKSEWEREVQTEPIHNPVLNEMEMQTELETADQWVQTERESRHPKLAPQLSVVVEDEPSTSEPRNESPRRNSDELLEPPKLRPGRRASEQIGLKPLKKEVIGRVESFVRSTEGSFRKPKVDEKSAPPQRKISVHPSGARDKFITTNKK